MPSDSPTFAQWRARPVFISSTFKDMQAERDYLQSHVFPRLEEKLRERRHHLEPIDLRIGVETVELDTEEAREKLVLKVCLEEIQRSRPYLLVILGDRYGWVPPAERMEAATQEAGFPTEVPGKSVTALEIEYGVFKKDPDQSTRSFFYFRRPLPYEGMPKKVAASFSDEYSDDASVRAGYDRLTTLKQELRNHPELGANVHDYAAEWDETAQRVTSLNEWGEMVFTHLWAALDGETFSAAEGSLITWQQQERAALAEFIAQHSRHFTGRDLLIRNLMDVATSPDRDPVRAHSASVGHSTTWGACVIGFPGSGKSALFAEIYQRLTKCDSVLILANVAGVTPRGSQPDAMLIRFIGELAAALEIANPLPDNPSPVEVDNTFSSIFTRAAETIRVVMMLDALDQFESTTKGQHLTWLRPQSWPANARLIATGVAGSAPIEVITKNAGLEVFALPGLTESNVAEIARSIWERHHRQVNQAVLEVILGKMLPDGRLASANPLWLTLALEQLNLLDADDFARIDENFSGFGSSGERLRAFLVETARSFPPEIPALYFMLLRHAEKTFGNANVRAFALLLASGRIGLRESDLLALVPSLVKVLYPEEASNTVDDLALACIRRGFRAHIVRHSSNGLLRLSHSQMQDAIRRFYVTDGKTLLAIHHQVALHLLSLPEEDSLRVSESMFHLIQADDKQRAAVFYSNICDSHSATESLKSLLLWEDRPQLNNGIAWVLALIGAGGDSGVTELLFLKRLQADVCQPLKQHLAPGQLVQLLEAIRERASKRLAPESQDSDDWTELAAYNWLALGSLHEEQGDFLLARQAYESASPLLKTVAKPGETRWIWLLGGAADGTARMTKRLEGAENAIDQFGKSAFFEHSISEIGAVEFTRILLNAAAKGSHGLSKAQQELYESFKAKAATNPEDWGAHYWLVDISLKNIVAMEASEAKETNLDERIALCKEAYKTSQRLLEVDPLDQRYLRHAGNALIKLTWYLREKSNHFGAKRACEEAVDIYKRLIALDPQNMEWQVELASRRLTKAIVYSESVEHTGTSLAVASTELNAALKLVGNVVERNSSNAKAATVLNAVLKCINALRESGQFIEGEESGG